MLYLQQQFFYSQIKFIFNRTSNLFRVCVQEDKQKGMASFLMKIVHYLKQISVLESVETIVVVTILTKAKTREVSNILLNFWRTSLISAILVSRSFKKLS